MITEKQKTEMLNWIQKSMEFEKRYPVKSDEGYETILALMDEDKINNVEFDEQHKYIRKIDWDFKLQLKQKLKKTMMKPEYFAENVNTFFVACNLMEELFNRIKPELQFEYKLVANNIIGGLSKFNRMAEKYLSQTKIEDFDQDTQTLFTLIEYSNRATKSDKHDLFMNKLNKIMDEIV